MNYENQRQILNDAALTAHIIPRVVYISLVKQYIQ